MSIEIELDLEELKQEADALGITYNQKIGAARLKEKIDAYYESQETSGKEIQAAIEAKTQEKSEEKSAENGNKEFEKRTKIMEKKAAALKTKVVTVIDNDQRVNNQTTTCKVTCANMYYDLGTAIIPLNTPVEVKQGHIDVLKHIKIPQHAKDPKTGLSETKLIPRYTVALEDVEHNRQ